MISKTTLQLSCKYVLDNIKNRNELFIKNGLLKFKNIFTEQYLGFYQHSVVVFKYVDLFFIAWTLVG